MPNFHEFTLQGIDGKEIPLEFFQDKVVMVVNVASECGLTPQYAKLQEMYDDLKGKDFIVLGVPCNQFGAQEPGTDAEIQNFCTSRYSVTFPMSTKIEVNGPDRHPLYQWMIGDGGDIEWNFEKFLVNGNGEVVERFSPQTTPDDPAVLERINVLLAS